MYECFIWSYSRWKRWNSFIVIISILPLLLKLEVYIKFLKEKEIIFILRFRKISINFVSSCTVCAIIYVKEKKSKELFFQKLGNSKLRTLLYWVTWPEWDLKFLSENRILVSQLKFILFFIYLLHDIPNLI